MGFIFRGLLLVIIWWEIGFNLSLLNLIGFLLDVGVIWCIMVLICVMSFLGENGLVM